MYDSDSSGSEGDSSLPKSNRGHKKWERPNRNTNTFRTGKMSATRGKETFSNNSTPQSLDFNMVKHWAHSAMPSDIVQDMYSKLGMLRQFLNREELPVDWIYFLSISVQKALRDKTQSAQVFIIVEAVAHSNFLDNHIPGFLSKVHEHPHIMQMIVTFFKAVFDIMDFIVIMFSECMSKSFVCISKIEEMGKRLNILPEGSDLWNQCFQLKIKSCPIPLIRDDEDMMGDGYRQRERKTVPAQDEEAPPDNFTEKSIFPDVDELEADANPFLRANKTTGPYRNLKHYTDVHFRLLREDYLRPLREGLRQFKESISLKQEPTDGDLRFYLRAQFGKMLIDDNDGIRFVVHFNPEVLGDIEWEFSKRFIFGSLLCLSKDNFQTIVFATVINRDAKKLAKGILEVTLQSNDEEILTSSQDDKYDIAETVAFFESYKHVLEGLQEVRELPLEEYILYCAPIPEPPKYVTQATRYALGSIMKGDEDMEVQVLNPQAWPEPEDTVLNAAQLEAVKLALTNEVAIIQGPPGTGKTYVGLHIMELLLNNRAKAFGKGNYDKPILVVCYTNHALDQFLEGILDFCEKGIIRIGGRSRSEKLEEFNLRKLRENPIVDRKLKRSIGFDLHECRKRLKKISYLIKNCRHELLNLDTSILSLAELEGEMTPQQARSMRDQSRGGGNGTEMNLWLKASNASIENHIIKSAEKHLTKLILQDGGNSMPDYILKDESKGWLGFGARVKIYRGWIADYKAVKYEDNDEEAFQRAERDILPDEEICPYMSGPKVYDSIKLTVEQECKQYQESTLVRCWLFGFFKTVDQILNEIEKMTGTKMSGGFRPNPRSGGAYRSEQRIYEDQVIVDSDSDNDADDADDVTKGFYDDSDEESESNSSASSETSRLVKEFMDLDVDYDAAERRGVSLLERAKMLQIEITEEDAGDDDPAGDQGWQVASQMTYGKFRRMIKQSKLMSKEEAVKYDDVWKLPMDKRYSLYKFWMLEKKKRHAQDIIQLAHVYNEFVKMKKQALSRKDIAILKQGQVIGMTTTGAARYRAVLQEVKPEIIIVEEAAEVLEAHIVTTLNKHCKHLILIGDHQQLRPNPTVHQLAVDYKLEISLFERLVKNNVKHVSLQVQHRMRPEISKYMKTIYPKLRDHNNVSLYNEVAGTASNVYFLNHKHREINILETRSRANDHEASFLVQLANYFLQQGYTSSQITILAAYSGQVACLREYMEQTQSNEDDPYRSMRVTSIDNYQGEENDIILLSLVRSNLEQDVGFLKTSNRVCVALSRAKIGLFVIGNLVQLEKSSKLWKNILATARASNEIGVFLTLVCRNHNHHQTFVQHAADFALKVPEGGCDQQCGAQLICGHFCQRKCHISDPDHSETLCEEDCFHTCSEGHPCPKRCHEDCGLCEVLVKKAMPFCGHQDFVPCHLSEYEACCNQVCKQLLDCGHLCKGLCGQCSASHKHWDCEELVEKVWSPCGDKCIVKCCTDVKVSPCEAKCREKLRCGDTCKGTCGECLTKRVHKPCEAKCRKALPCGHQCQSKCSLPCEPCKKACPSLCRHSACSKKTCGEACDLCKENCDFVCKHQQCSERCADECSKKPCNQRCNKQTKCNHPCKSICNELCVCFSCEQKQFSLIDFAKSKPGNTVFADRDKMEKFVPDKDTIFMKIPGCQHFFTLKQLDEYVKKFDPEGSSYIRCPRCSKTIQGICRYDELNKTRSHKRRNRKFQLEQYSMVSEKTIDRLQYSISLIQNFCPFDLDHYLRHQDASIKISHANALCLLSRYAFVLYLITEIHKEFNPTKSFNADKWKRSIKSNQRGITAQFEDEMSMELHRLILSEQLLAFKQFFDDAEVLFEEQLKTEYKRTMKNDLIQQLTPKLKNKAELLTHELFQLLSTSDLILSAKQSCESLMDKAKLAKSILDEPRNLDLQAVLEKHGILPSPVASDQSESESEDEESDEDSEASED